MPDLFGGAPGRVVAIDTNATAFVPLGLIVDDFKGTVGAKCLLTTLSVGGESSHQIMHTLRQYIYVYTFGERVGQISAGGICLVDDCSSDNGRPVSSTGLARLFDWYERNRISTTGAPIKVTLTPGVVLNAFLTSFRYQMEDPSIGLGQFQLQLFYPPRASIAGQPPAFPQPSQTGATSNPVLQFPNGGGPGGSAGALFAIELGNVDNPTAVTLNQAQQVGGVIQ